MSRNNPAYLHLADVQLHTAIRATVALYKAAQGDLERGDATAATRLATYDLDLAALRAELNLRENRS